MITKTSFQFSADTKDFLASLLMAVAGAVWALIAPNITEIIAHPTAPLIFDITAIWHTAVATGILTLATRFLRPAKIETPAE